MSEPALVRLPRDCQQRVLPSRVELEDASDERAAHRVDLDPVRRPIVDIANRVTLQAISFNQPYWRTTASGVGPIAVDGAAGSGTVFVINRNDHQSGPILDGEEVNLKLPDSTMFVQVDSGGCGAVIVRNTGEE